MISVRTDITIIYDTRTGELTLKNAGVETTLFMGYGEQCCIEKFLVDVLPLPLI